MSTTSHYLSDLVSNIEPSLTMSITALAGQLRAEGKDVIGFGAGEPDFDTPDAIKQAAIRSIESGKSKYTAAAGLPELKDAISKRLMADYQVAYDPSQIVVSCGAKHSLHNVFFAILNSGDEVIVPAPYWVSYPEQIAMTGARMVTVPTTVAADFKVTVADLAPVLTNKTKAIVLNSPSNPTGSVYTEAELKTLCDWAVANNIWIISDEIYDKLIYDGRHVCVPSLSKDIQDRTILVNGVSKSYAMTGWRIGYFAAPQPIASAVARLQSHTTSNPTTMAQYAAIEAFTMDQSILDDMRQTFDTRRKIMLDRLNAMPGITMNQPKGAFYAFPKIDALFGKITPSGVTLTDSLSFCEALLADTGVACVPGIGFGSEGYMRLSYATSDELIEDGLSRLHQWVTTLISPSNS
ncbi:MAG: pyridoxal phosphate-dependent aminotransferase [Candidatus Marinamargulisbacteria bacterium]